MTKLGIDIWNLKRKYPFIGGGQNPASISFILSLSPNWNLHSAFSLRMLKHFSDIIYGPIIAVRSSNDVSWCPQLLSVKRV